MRAFKPDRLFIINLLFFLSAVVLSSCTSATDLAKVRQFSKLSNQLEDNLPGIAEDFYRSCLRRVQYVPVTPLPPDNAQSGVPIPDSLNEPDGSPNIDIPDVPKDPLAQRVKLREIFCDGDTEQGFPDLREINPNFTRVNGVVISYVGKLGLVAEPNLTNLDAEFDTIGANANNLASSTRSLFLATQKSPVPDASSTTVISEEQLNQKVDAVVNIFQFVTELFLEAERREVLETMIVDSNADLQLLLDDLELIVKNFYIENLLRAEEEALDQMYQEYITALETSDTFQSGSNVIQVTNHLRSLDNDWNEKKGIIQSRRELAQAYIGVLNSLSGGHALLFEIFSEGKTPTEKQMKSIVEDNTSALKNFIDKSKALKDKEVE